MPPVPGGASSDAVLTALMARFRRTRRGADFEALYRVARAPVLGWVLGGLGRGSAAVDPFELVQDTFVNIYRYAEGFRHEDDASFRRWARTIAGNVVRRAGRARASGVGSASFTALEGDPADPAPGPGHGLEVGEATRILGRAYGLLLLQYAAAFATLGPRARRALTLVEVERRSYREVAAELGVGLSNTKMIVFRARARLRAHLERSLGTITVQPAASGRAA